MQNFCRYVQLLHEEKTGGDQRTKDGRGFEKGAQICGKKNKRDVKGSRDDNQYTQS